MCVCVCVCVCEGEQGLHLALSTFICQDITKMGAEMVNGLGNSFLTLMLEGHHAEGGEVIPPPQ